MSVTSLCKAARSQPPRRVARWKYALIELAAPIRFGVPREERAQPRFDRFFFGEETRGIVLTGE